MAVNNNDIAIAIYCKCFILYIQAHPIFNMHSRC